MTRVYVSVPRNAPLADLMTIVSNEIQVLGNMFRPSPPSYLQKDTYELFYPLIQSPESSLATRFTTTTASSADPLPITVTSLLRLGFRCRSYNVPAQAAIHQVRSITLSLPTHLPLLRSVTERIWGFGSRWYLALTSKPARGSHRA